jgi:hypothetical protein
MTSKSYASIVGLMPISLFNVPVISSALHFRRYARMLSLARAARLFYQMTGIYSSILLIPENSVVDRVNSGCTDMTSKSYASIVGLMPISLFNVPVISSALHFRRYARMLSFWLHQSYSADIARKFGTLSLTL